MQVVEINHTEVDTHIKENGMARCIHTCWPTMQLQKREDVNQASLHTFHCNVHWYVYHTGTSMLPVVVIVTI